VSVTALVRPEIREMRPYRSAQFEAGLVRLNANENPWRPVGDDSSTGLNWYPEPRPFALSAALAAHYGVPAERLLVTRGSSEAIDVVIRAFCRAGQDEVVICPPTFGMYETYAQIQGAGIRRVPLLRERGYAEIVPVIGQYEIDGEGGLLLTTEYETMSSVERFWFANPNLRLRTSVVKRFGGFSTASFCAESRLSGESVEDAAAVPETLPASAAFSAFGW